MDNRLDSKKKGEEGRRNRSTDKSVKYREQRGCQGHKRQLKFNLGKFSRKTGY